MALSFCFYTIWKVLEKMNVQSFFKRNTSTILTCLGGAGVIATSVMAVKATPKALKLVEKAEEKKGRKLTKWEKTKTITPSYIPSFIVGAATISSIFGANVLNRRQQASLMSAYALLDSSYKDYKNKLVELYGEEAHQNIMDSIAVEKAEDIYINASYLGSGCNLATEESSSKPVLFYDEYSERFFETTIEQVITAEYHLNRNYILRGSSVLNELYDFLGLEPTDYGSTIGWAPMDDGMYWIDFNHRKAVAEDGTEFYILEMPFAPGLEYDEY